MRKGYNMEELYKQRFKELFFNQIGLIKIKILCDSRNKNSYIKYFYTKDKKYLGEYNSNIKYFWLSYTNIWSKFESEFNLNYQEIRDLTSGIFVEHYKLRGITTLFQRFDAGYYS
jgi:hypothetical protein